MSEQKHKMNSVNLKMVLTVTGLVMMGMIGSNVLSIYGDTIAPTSMSLTNDSPLKQFQSGTASKDIKCNNGLQLVIKTKDDSPACVKPSTAITLVSWGWAKSIIKNTTAPTGGQASNKTITLADNGKSITLNTGESFLLKLGESYNWNIVVDNQTVLSRMTNVMVVRGAQGIYEAHNPGQTTLTGVGDPLCLSAVPSCKMPSIHFQLGVVVMQMSDNTNSSLAVLTEKDQYGIGEAVNITITNTGNTRLFPNGWGYSINGIDGSHYAPNGVLRMMLVALTPGNSTHWTWDQLDANGTQVLPGKYNITASYSEENASRQVYGSRMIEIR